MRPRRLPISTATRWKIRSALMLAKSQVPHGLRHQTVHLGYYSGPNFGDALSPLITSFVLGAPVREAHYAGADLTAVGSVLDTFEKYRNRTNPYIWGSGYIQDGPAWSGTAVTPCAVRGALTRARLQHLSDSPIPLGDPGLLVSRMYPSLQSVQKRYRVGVIPHIREKYSDKLNEFRGKSPDIQIIDPAADPRLVLEQIAASQFIVSSSLHGLVCSDALGVPNIWTPISSAVEGAGYKFHDYYSAFGIEARSMSIDVAIRSTDDLIASWEQPVQIESLVDGLIEAFPRDALKARYR